MPIPFDLGIPQLGVSSREVRNGKKGPIHTKIFITALFCLNKKSFVFKGGKKEDKVGWEI